jgi:hypothetical protein
MRTGARIAWILALGGVLLASGARGETVSDTAHRRVLGGHTFVPAGGLREPFIVTSVTNTLEYGSSQNLKNPVLVVDGEPLVTLEGKLAFFSIRFAYHQAVREWLAAWIWVGGTGRLGSNTTSLLAQGINAGGSWETGWTMRLAQRERWILSASVALENTSVTVVNVLEWADTGASLVRSTSALAGTLGLRGAYALNRTVGLLGSIQSGYGESYDPRAPDKWFVVVDAAASLNLRASRGWPLGFVLAVGYSSLPEAGEDIGERQGVVLARIAYTGREDFVIGVDITNQWLPQYLSSEPVRASTVGLGFNYYF